MKTFQQFLCESSISELPDPILKAVQVAYFEDKEKVITFLRSFNNQEIIEILDKMNQDDLNSNSPVPEKNTTNDIVVPNLADNY